MTIFAQGLGGGFFLSASGNPGPEKSQALRGSFLLIIAPPRRPGSLRNDDVRMSRSASCQSLWLDFRLRPREINKPPPSLCTLQEEQLAGCKGTLHPAYGAQRPTVFLPKTAALGPPKMEHKGVGSQPQQSALGIPNLLLSPNFVMLISPWIKLSSNLASQHQLNQQFSLAQLHSQRGKEVLRIPLQVASRICYGVRRGHWHQL